MTTINLSGQQLERDDIAPKLQKLKAWMDERKIIWNKLDDETQRKWIRNAATHDPIMDIAWDVYMYLHNNFFEDLDQNDI